MSPSRLPFILYLFIIIVKALKDAIKKATRIGLIIDISLPQCNPQQLISQYVDDTLIIVRAKGFSMDNVVGILHNFRLASCLKIKWHKNVAYWCNGGTPLEWVKNIIGSGQQKEIFQIYLAPLLVFLWRCRMLTNSF